MLPRLALLAILPLLLALLLPSPCLANDLALDPDIDEGHRQFAHANYEEALEHYLKALERNKEDAYLHFRAWLTSYILGDFDSSEIYRIKAASLDSSVSNGLIYKISSEDMFPSLLVGDIVSIDDKYYYKDLRYGDIVFFISPHDEKTILNKRVVGLPGDYIEIADNRVIRNDIFIEESYQYAESSPNQHATTDMNRKFIPKKCYFVLGDNRNWSYDSRYCGCIPRENILGKGVAVMESFEQIDGQVTQRSERVGILIK